MSPSLFVPRRQALCRIVLALGVLLCLTGCGRTDIRQDTAVPSALQVASTDAYTQVRRFVLQHMVGEDGGVYTNFLDSSSQGNETRGHDVLAESQGLLMLYAVQVRDETLFDSSWYYVQRHLLRADGLVAWRCVAGVPADTNATVDDLRICRALRIGSTVFHNKAYRKAADRIADALYRSCRSGEVLYDSASDGQSVQVSYLDLAAMDANAAVDRRWKPIAQWAHRLVSRALFSERLPLYRQTYDPRQDRFAGQTQYDMVSSMLALYYQSETAQAPSRALQWLRENPRLFAGYDADGKAVSSVQSTAIYALAMLTARASGDGALYQNAGTALTALQIRQNGSMMNGAFGDAKTQQAYSFDNLLALLALAPSAETRAGDDGTS